jgi:hypothetical protein
VNKTEIDLKRMIPFGLVFLLATEYIPLIIIFAPQMIPSTCVTPTQLVKTSPYWILFMDTGIMPCSTLTDILLTSCKIGEPP